MWYPLAWGERENKTTTHTNASTQATTTTTYTTTTTTATTMTTTFQYEYPRTVQACTSARTSMVSAFQIISIAGPLRNNLRRPKVIINEAGDGDRYRGLGFRVYSGPMLIMLSKSLDPTIKTSHPETRNPKPRNLQTSLTRQTPNPNPNPKHSCKTQPLKSKH